MLRLEGCVKDYDWGNSNFIDDFLGRKSDGTAKAELWFSSHPGGRSIVVETGKELDIKNFPFLLKILAINRCLSLQVHPTKDQAVDGLKRVPEDYQDSNQKAEVFCALTDVVALCGFQSISSIRQNFNGLFPSDNPIKNSSTIEDIFMDLNLLDLNQKRRLLISYEKALSNRTDQRAQIGSQLVSRYPKDIAALAPYFLNVVNLKPLEAIYLKPRVIHCYVSGNGVELMNSSDNVLRAGLTAKHMDLRELRRISEFSHLDARAVKKENHDGLIKYVLPNDAGFSLSLVEKDKASLAEGMYRIMLCTEGEALINGIKVKKGEALLTNDKEEVTIDATDGQVFIAGE